MNRSFTAAQIAAFRLGRHHLATLGQPDLVAVCRHVCGIQAQVMSAAQIALWTRKRDLTQEAIQSALWEQRTLVKTYGMRGTLHVFTATDFPIYISAMKTSRTRQSMAIMARYGVTEKHVYAATEAAVQALESGPMAKRELTQRVLSQISVGKKARFFFERASWGVSRQAVVEGLVCYGPDRDKQVSIVRVDQWLPKQAKVPEQEAQRVLLRLYLSAYGPATLRDFSKWAGLSVPEGKAVGELLKDELVEVDAENEKALILRRDLGELRNSSLAADVVRLLPYFDPYMLAHVDKDHLVPPRHYKRVYRNQGWISPVVLLNGRVIGVWSYARAAKRWTLEIEPFEKFSKGVRSEIEEEAAGLAQFLGISWQINFG